MHSFKAELKIVGVNPYAEVPGDVLRATIDAAGTHRGKIPIHGEVNGVPYTQTLVRFQGEWRLYVNTKMLKHSPKRVGEILDITLAIDPSDRSIAPHPKLAEALNANTAAKEVFEGLRPSLQHEIVRYISRLKSEASIDKNIARAIQFLLGNERFIGRDRP